MESSDTYDLGIAGGGLAGLSLSIQLAAKGYSVILFEKEQYPFHRVCGEYISMESWDFLEQLGLDLCSMNVSRINRLQVTTPGGTSLVQPLKPGGFGISRYHLDDTLVQLAGKKGVTVLPSTLVDRVSFTGNDFVFHTNKGDYQSRLAAGCFGKRSRLDINWKRSFVQAKKSKLNNYIGVKYHVHADFPDDLIALHNFQHGYCGMVKVDQGKYNLCYLSNAANLQKCGNSVPEMERSVLAKNPFLERIFSESTRVTEEPVIISQVSFDKKSQVEDHVLMIGDAAGMITPLCGNGMSMALHASKLAAGLMIQYLENQISREKLEQEYCKQWKNIFSARMRMGRTIQRLFWNRPMINALVRLGRVFPPITRSLVRQTHGDPF
jgi:menaquinone-9 beta-reductase